MEELIPIWLHEAASRYNSQSLANRDAYAAVLLMPIQNLATILDWTFQSLPDEILVGMDPDHQLENPEEVVEAYAGADQENRLFAGQGYLLGEPHLVNRGDSFEVHHVPAVSYTHLRAHET